MSHRMNRIKKELWDQAYGPESAPATPAGQTRQDLLAERILFRDAKGHVCAYRERIDAGYFRGIETPYTHPESGEVRVSCQIKVTPAGVEFIAKRLGVAVVPQEMEVAS